MRVTISLEEGIHRFIKLKGEHEGKSMGEVIGDLVRKVYGSCSTSILQLALLPSGLLRKALEDFEACERDGQYVIEPESMIEFNLFDCNDPRIMVGVSGALLVKSLGVSPSRGESWNVSAYEESLVYAVGWLSEGNVGRALEELSIDKRLESLAPMVSHPRYSKDPNGYKDSLRSLADALASEGL